MNTLCTVVNRFNVETLCLSKPPQKTENLFINFVHTETVRNKRRSERKLRRKVHLRFRKKKVAVKIVYSAEWSNSRFATMSQNVWLAYVVRLRSCKLSIEAGGTKKRREKWYPYFCLTFVLKFKRFSAYIICLVRLLGLHLRCYTANLRQDKVDRKTALCQHVTV